jgi:hypothetical protein
MGRRQLTPNQRSSGDRQSQCPLVPAKPDPHPLLQLQAAIGNRAVNQWLQTQAAANAPAHAPKPLFRGLSHELGAELSGPTIQTKLTVGQADDPYEQEADRVAKQVMRQVSAPIGSSAGAGAVQAQFQEKKDAVQRQSPIDGPTVAPDVEASINRSRGGGRSLPRSLRDRFEPAMGADLSQVRVHTDGSSHQLNAALQARAFTTGQDVFFRQGAYDPGSHQGQELIAHELTHVMQQNQTGQSSLKRQNRNTANPASVQPSSHLIQPVDRIQRGTDPQGSSDPTLKEIKSRKAEEIKAAEEAKEESIKKRYGEIESQKPKTFKDLDEIAQQSQYKHLRKIGGDSDNYEYETEYKEANLDKTKGTLGARIARIQNYRGKLETLEVELILLRKPANVAQRIARESQITAKAGEIERLKEEIIAEESFLRAQKAPVKDWKTLELDEAKLKDRKVDYLTTPPERKNFALHITSGTMKQKPGETEKLYDTQKSYTAIQGQGWGIYVMDPNGQFYAGPHTVGRFHHSSFLAGGAIAGAGELKVRSGKLEEINNKSGHYRPGLYQVVQTLTQLDKDGVNLNAVKLTTANVTPPGNGLASTFLDRNKGILSANEASAEGEVVANSENDALKALGLYSMNGAWYTLKNKLSDDDLAVYKKIIANGGSERLFEEGFTLEEGVWKKPNGDRVKTAQDFLDTLIGHDSETDESEGVDEEERYETIVDDLEEEIGRERIIELLKDKIEGLKWDGLQWLQGDEDVEKAAVGKAIEEVQSAQAQ